MPDATKPYVVRNDTAARWQPKFEVFAPDGHQFDDGQHSFVCYDKDEVKKALASPFSPCPTGCDCQE